LLPVPGAGGGGAPLLLPNGLLDIYNSYMIHLLPYS
jgi:hypothetical protein